MYSPHPNRNFLDRNLIGAVRRVACRVGCCGVVAICAVTIADQALAADAPATVLPRFLDAQSLDSLRHALLTPKPDTATPTADAIMPRFHGAAAMAKSGAMILASPGNLDLHAPQAALVAPIAAPGDSPWGVPSSGDITTSHFQQTLTGARREAGEARELADEVRRRAEELTRRFASDSQGREASISRAVSNVPAAPPREAASPTAAAAMASAQVGAASMPAPGGAVETIAAAGIPNAVIGSNEDDKAPVAGLHSVPSDASPKAQLRSLQPVATAATDAPTPRAPKERSGVRSNPAADSGIFAGGAVVRAPGLAASTKRKTGVAAASPSAGPVRKLAKAAATGSHGAPAEKTVAAERVAKSDVKPSQSDDAGKADAQPGPEPKSAGGLLSWLKPFAFPKEIGGLGWASTD